MIEQDRLERILRAAVQAPSGDNSQPWSFRAHDDEIDIFVHPERDHAILNVESRGTYLSLGAVIENLLIAAEHEGLLCDVSSPLDTHAAAIVKFVGHIRPNHPLIDAVAKRHTNRGAYKTEISEEILDGLRALEVGSAHINVVTDRKRIEAIANAVSMMEEAALRTKELHYFFFQSILWDAHKNKNGEPGLYIKTTELPPPIQFLFKLIKYWPIMRALNAIGFASMAAKSNAAVYASSGAIVAISIDRTESRDYISAGRAFERAWLKVVNDDFAAQPLAGLLYLAEYLRLGSNIRLEPDVQARILEARRVIYDAFECKEGTIAMLLRIGEPIRPATARSNRKPPGLLAV
ncbi:MAG: hypothetical protein P4L81_04040 [Candidatus Pacebacteria bacterium]|nr:hypothetical protein [Candidatus Paceibacterota bacterium]